MGKAYPVGLVGESHYQDAIGRCMEGEPVEVAWEVDNPYSPNALVVTYRGFRLGYIAEDSWLQAAVHDEGFSCRATLLERRGRHPRMAVILSLETTGGPIPQASYYREEPKRTFWQRLMGI